MVQIHSPRPLFSTKYSRHLVFHPHRCGRFCRQSQHQESCPAQSCSHNSRYPEKYPARRIHAKSQRTTTVKIRRTPTETTEAIAMNVRLSRVANSCFKSRRTGSSKSSLEFMKIPAPLRVEFQETLVHGLPAFRSRSSQHVGMDAAAAHWVSRCCRSIN